MVRRSTPVEDQLAEIEKADRIARALATAGGGGGGGSRHTIQDEGGALPDRSVMNFVGAGVTVTDAGGKTVVTIPGGGGGGSGNSYFPSGW